MGDNISKKDLIEALDHVLQARRSVPEEVHKDDHDFLKILKQREERRVKRWEKFRLSLIGTIATSLGGGIIAIGAWVVGIFGHHPPPPH